MRIIGGRFGGRRLVAPAGDRTRPTSDKVREALFNLLGDVDGLRVLDLYAGTGALALEALSRGAAAAVCVESARPALASLRANLDTLGASVTVIAKPVERAARDVAAHGPFELVMCDPPYALVASGEAARALEAYVAHATDGALFTIEHGAKAAAPAVAGLTFEETRTWGDTSITLLRR